MNHQLAPQPNVGTRAVRASHALDLRQRGMALAALALLVVVACALTAGPARASSPIEKFYALPSTTQAGGHPNIVIFSRFGNRDTQNFPSECFCQDPKNVKTSLPTGVIGNPHATPQCTRVDFGASQCPPSTQVGVANIDLFDMFFHVAVYNLEPDPQQAGLLGFFAPLANAPLFLVISARTGSDYGLDTTLTGVEHIIPPKGVELTLWGVPADPVNDAERAPIFKNPSGCSDGAWPCFPPRPSNAEVVPFLDNPTTCELPRNSLGEAVSLSSRMEILAYDHGVTEAESPWPETTGCDQLSFNPSLYAQPTTRVTDAASGLDVDLSVPQLASPSAPSPSEIRALTVTLPEGMTINPNAADGKSSCSDAEANFGTELAAQCPEDAKVGTVSLTSSALPAALPGGIYIGEPKPGERYRLILTADGYNTHVKLAGMVEPNPSTGRLVVSFPNLPQSPFSDFNLHFFGSERGLLATPTQCGTFAVESSFTPWDEALSEQTSTQYFDLSSGPSGGLCPGPVRPLHPGFEAGVTNATAAAHSPYFIELTRPDGDQNLSGLSVRQPPGLLASLKGVPYCPDESIKAAADPSYSGLAEEASPSCPAASLIGTATVGAGAGTHPLYLPGRVYLAGPYKGAPLSLVVITPAVSGPYDLGSVVVRAALNVNTSTAQITATSDPLPQILQGIPLRLRSILLELNRPNFTLNPTDCVPLTVGAEVFGNQGGLATPSAPFQVAGCRDLGFSPKLSLKLSGGTKRAANPALRAVLSEGSGDANPSRVSVALPHALFLDNAHIRNPCLKPQLEAGNCPESAVIGSASADTPLLEKPLEGPVYLVAGFGHKLPDLVVDLKGQINILLDGRIDTDSQEGLRTTFETVPDAPVSTFTLNLDGGKSGLLVNSENLCKSKPVATVKIAGQNGKSAELSPALQRACGAAARHKRHLDRGEAVG